ncbi:probable G-protein coupled receptor 34 [Solea solea]|uniref:probable G-protein coupled receptor 34 n=1 Tax=Solea solea TaxID=90069 RepID=UPI00272A501A|nr:probable G-protein coupled receptor 34 [Solea solea]
MTATNSTSSSSSESLCVDYGALQILLAVLYSIIFILGLVGNVVALGVFFCVRVKKNSVRVFLINVAFADLLLVTCLPFRILYHSRGNMWDLDPVLCTVVGNVFYMNMYISVTLLGLISVDRYMKIHRTAGVQHRLKSTKWTSALCALVWITSIAIGSTLMISKSDRSQSNRCFHYKQLHHAKWRAYINISMLVVFWLVFFGLVVSYGKIANSLLRRSQDKPDLPNAAHYGRTARKSFFVLFLFTVCFVPYHLVRGFYIMTQITDTPCYWIGVVDKANEVALLLSALNSCLDPVMYFLLSSSVRKEVTRLLSDVCRVRDAAAAVSGSSSTAENDSRNVAEQRELRQTSVPPGQNRNGH